MMLMKMVEGNNEKKGGANGWRKGQGAKDSDSGDKNRHSLTCELRNTDIMKFGPDASIA